MTKIDSRSTEKKERTLARDLILSSMTEGVLVIDNDHKLLMINDSALSYLDIHMDSPIGKTTDKVIKDHNFLSFLHRLSRKHEALIDEIKIKKHTDRFFLVNGTILQGEQPSVLVVMSDITKLKQLEKIRQQFVANVSHELKTPITSIVGFLETLKQKNIPKEKQKSFLKKALKHSNRLNSIIDDLLWLSLIESKEEDKNFDLFPQQLLQIIQAATDDVQTMAEKNNNIIEIFCEPFIQIKADSQLFREALINLLGNAIKYGSQSKPIRVMVEKKDKLYIHVQNHGEPIPEKYKETIFHRFARIDKSRSREKGGTGLGLAIVKHIVFVHDGEITVKSSAETGTIFTISLPVI